MKLILLLFHSFPFVRYITIPYVVPVIAGASGVSAARHAIFPAAVAHLFHFRPNITLIIVIIYGDWYGWYICVWRFALGPALMKVEQAAEHRVVQFVAWRFSLHGRDASFEYITFTGTINVGIESNTINIIIRFLFRP